MVTKPQAIEDGVPVLIFNSFYVVSGSVGLETRALKPFCMALDTGTGYSLIRKRILRRGYEEYLAQDGSIPALCDTNDKRLATHGAVMPKVRLENAIFTMCFMVAERLAGDVLIGFEFLNHNLQAIRPRSQMVELRGERSLPSPHDMDALFINSFGGRVQKMTLASQLVRHQAPWLQVKAIKGTGIRFQLRFPNG